jgi:hypothetical protein
MKSNGVSVLVLALLALFFVACPLLTYTEVEDNTVPLTGQARLYIRNLNGGVRLIASVDNSVGLHMTKRVTGPDEVECRNRMPDIKIAVTDTGSIVGVFVDLPAGEAYSYGVDIEARLPAGLLTDIGTSNGDISAGDFTRPMKLATTNGTIDVSNISASVEASTTNGRITMDGIAGSVKGNNTNGSVDVEVVLPDSGFCRLASTNGSMALRIPDSTSARVYVSTTNGEIRRNSLMIAGNVGRQEIDGQLGDGRGEINITTTNGDVVLTGY